MKQKNKLRNALGNRMKEFYEVRTQTKLPRRTYAIIRIDDKAFHTYTRGLDKPFDDGLMHDMNKTAIYLCNNIQGAKFAFVQSDEISIVLTDFDTLETSAWFDYEVQKITSVSASMATAKFNQMRTIRFVNNNIEKGHDIIDSIWLEKLNKLKLAEFDSRVFSISYWGEVINYFIWRQNDAKTNSVSIVADSLFSHNELMNKNNEEKKIMCLEAGVDWNALDDKYKYGRLIAKTPYDKNGTTRYKWVTSGAPLFNEDENKLILKKLLLV